MAKQKPPAQAAQTKEKKYFHISIYKLADAFENQFFANIKQMENQEMFPTSDRSSVYRTQDQSLIVSRTGSEMNSPRATMYESVTIKKQYD